MTSSPEAFILLSIDNASISSGSSHYSGTLNLQCVTRSSHTGGFGSPAANKDVYLVLHLQTFESVIDPSSVIRLHIASNGLRTYTIEDPYSQSAGALLLRIQPPSPSANDLYFGEDIETFEGILAQYAEFESEFSPTTPRSTSAAQRIPPPEKNDVIGPAYSGGHGDLRGHLVLVNQDNGEVVGQFEDKIHLNEDPALKKPGHENDAVLIEIPEQRGDGQVSALDAFVRAIPPEDQDWMTKSATVASHAISTTTNLLLTTITTASNYYINHSKPSPHHPAQIQARTKSAGDANSAPPPPPPRALVFLTSERTRKGLHNVHAVTGQAVQVSAKTISVVDSMIKRAVGTHKGKGKQQPEPVQEYGQKPAYGRQQSASAPVSRSHSPLPPPSYTEKPPLPTRNGEKLPLPDREGPYASRSALPPVQTQLASGSGSAPPLPPRGKMSMKGRILLSADLILSTIDNSAKQLLDTGSNQLSAVMGHKYGEEAAQNTKMMTGSMRNVALVYIDMRGIGRTAILKRAGKEYVKGKVTSGKNKA